MKWRHRLFSIDAGIRGSEMFAEMDLKALQSYQILIKEIDCGTAWTLLSLQPSSLEKAMVEPSCWMAGTTQDLNLA